MQNLFLLMVASLFGISGCAHASITPQRETCELSSALQKDKSAELLKIAQADQDDRAGPFDSIDWIKVNPRDTDRKVEVARIFAEGCFKTASDYASAALVFQHGTTADHFYQTFHWADEAVKLGDSSQRWLTAAGLDRYLVKIGHQQLFGTQLSKGRDGNWCVQPVDITFPESRRIEYVKLSLKDELSTTLRLLGSTLTADDIKNCEPSLKPSPRGTVPGFW